MLKVDLMRLFAARGVRRTADNSPVGWRRSTYSSYNGNCVEIAGLPDALIGVRDSKNIEGGSLRFSAAEWDAFVGSIRSGNFGHGLHN